MMRHVEDRCVCVCGVGMASAHGLGTGCHLSGIISNSSVFRPLGELFGFERDWSHVVAGWLPDRSMLAGRRQGPASQLALLLARQAVDDAGWSADDLRDCAIVVGSSRGNAAGWLDEGWSGRRRLKLLSAPNSLHSELASTISIEMGIQGPYHVLASGCAAGLDAVGVAAMLIRSGVADRAIAVGLDLPLSPTLLDTYWASRMLSVSGRNDPYHPEADGMIIAEGGAALALGRSDAVDPGRMKGVVVDYRSNSDAYNPLGMLPDGKSMGRLIGQGLKAVEQGMDGELFFCPHASGTRGNAVSELAAWTRCFDGGYPPNLCMIKPHVGHTIGGSGILELAMMIAFATEGVLPPVTGASFPVDFPAPRRLMERGDLVMKTAASMGGHNALVSVQIVKS